MKVYNLKNKICEDLLGVCISRFDLILCVINLIYRFSTFKYVKSIRKYYKTNL